jgi:hypothetical protein
VEEPHPPSLPLCRHALSPATVTLNTADPVDPGSVSDTSHPWCAMGCPAAAAAGDTMRSPTCRGRRERGEIRMSRVPRCCPPPYAPGHRCTGSAAARCSSTPGPCRRRCWGRAPPHLRAEQHAHASAVAALPTDAQTHTHQPAPTHQLANPHPRTHAQTRQPAPTHPRTHQPASAHQLANPHPPACIHAPTHQLANPHPRTQAPTNPHPRTNPHQLANPCTHAPSLSALLSSTNATCTRAEAERPRVQVGVSW